MAVSAKSVFSGQQERSITSPAILTSSHSSPSRKGVTLGLRLGLSKDMLLRMLLSEKSEEEINNLAAQDSIPSINYHEGGILPKVEHTQGKLSEGAELFITLPTENCKILIEALKAMHVLSPLTAIRTPRHEEYTQILLNNPTSCPDIDSSTLPILETSMCGVLTKRTRK